MCIIISQVIKYLNHDKPQQNKILHQPIIRDPQITDHA